MFKEGQPVYWLYTSPGGWNLTYRVKAMITKVNAKTITIEMELKTGGKTKRMVKPEKLEAREG